METQHTNFRWVGIIVIVLIFLIAYGSMEKRSFMVYGDSPNVFMITSSWWGLKKEKNLIIWIHAPGMMGPQWMYWHPTLGLVSAGLGVL